MHTCMQLNSRRTIFTHTYFNEKMPKMRFTTLSNLSHLFIYEQSFAELLWSWNEIRFAYNVLLLKAMEYVKIYTCTYIFLLKKTRELHGIRKTLDYIEIFCELHNWKPFLYSKQFVVNFTYRSFTLYIQILSAANIRLNNSILKCVFRNQYLLKVDFSYKIPIKCYCKLCVEKIAIRWKGAVISAKLRIILWKLNILYIFGNPNKMASCQNHTEHFNFVHVNGSIIARFVDPVAYLSSVHVTLRGTCWAGFSHCYRL